MIRLSKVTLLVALVGFLTSCGGGQTEGKKEPASSQDEIRLKQYKVAGEKIYSTYCANCHQPDGKGLAALYPPLAASDYLLENFARAACIVKNGQFKEIEVNGVKFNQMMPANPITNIEIAQVLTYVTNTWGNEAGLISVKKVDTWIDECEEE